MDNSKNNSFIAVFDSGVGGISVLKEMVKLMPNENYVYYGDSLHAPYGTKTRDEVCQLTMDCAAQLFAEGAKALMVACNTATSAAVRKLREEYPKVPIVGIEPALKPAANAKEYPTVLVMATPMTIREKKFRNLMAKYADQADVIPLPCPGLMDFVERGDLHGEDLKKYLVELLYAYRSEKIDSVVLGCTHYPFVKDEIVEILGSNVEVFDGGEGCAREMRRRLKSAGLLTDRTTEGSVVIRNSLPNPQPKIALCEQLLREF